MVTSEGDVSTTLVHDRCFDPREQLEAPGEWTAVSGFGVEKPESAEELAKRHLPTRCGDAVASVSTKLSDRAADPPIRPAP